MSVQNNDNKLLFPDEAEVGMATASEIVYMLRSENKQKLILQKKLTDAGNDVEMVDGNLVVSISKAESANLVGNYYEEIKIKNLDDEVFTVHRAPRHFEASYITEI